MMRITQGSKRSACARRGIQVKVNLPVFKDENSKDCVTYDTWQWDVAIPINLVGMIMICYLTSFAHYKDSQVTKPGG